MTATAKTRPMSLSSGATLGPYAIRAELGHGGMGVVYTAQKRQVARVECFWVSPRAVRARGRHLPCYSEIGIESKGVSLCTQNS